MNGTLTAIAVFFLAIPTAVLTLAVSHARRADNHGHPVSPAVEEALTASRTRALLALVSALVTLTVCTLSPAFRGSLGVPLALAPTLSASVGLLMYALIPSALDSTPGASSENLRYASLEARQPWSFVTTGQAVSLTAITALLLALLTAAGMSASADDLGRPSRAIAITSGNVGSVAGPYPGWFYGVPMLAGTIILAGSAFLALRRVAATPALPGPGLESRNRHWNLTSTRIIMGVTQSAMLLQIAGVTATAALALRNVSRGMSGYEYLSHVGTALLPVAAAAMLGSGILAVVTAVRALTLPDAVR